MSSDCSCSSCSCQSVDSKSCSEVAQTDSTITYANRIDHVLARWGYKRSEHRISPGLYKLGNPNADSPGFASANYTLSFDILRSSLKRHDAYILVLDTKGINVWCAAGKGTFGTDELIHQIEATGLANIVSHRKIVVPQLGAPGVSAPEVQRRSGFRVEYGPVRAKDLPEYLKTGKATPEMRRVEFSTYDRLVLTPVELVQTILPGLIAAVALWFLAGPLAAVAVITTIVTGTILFPVLLPIIPTKDFSTKGLILGLVAAIPFAASYASVPTLPYWTQIAGALVPLLIIPPVVSYLGLNFTGSTTYTSRTGVKKEIFKYVPVMVTLSALGIIIGVALGVFRIMGMI
ncbi:mercury methylation corrinoid protein HgcA [Methanospirillum lacunae]|uniref:Carbon monoxide dehydrogenase n=1 Tax=Methanospirillum lacunae TaxID=668570 RepID=A0A2V2N5L2_9EURY|nr:mercury methylation corrinoid protein HgcA [Methanospirillum lacunae]PWR73036.1 carbon monoxide dehydrogenase [Methanospirillum lacunae]